jgi:diadenosine tetraphosphatase ApaH/serine/threonine PP2A family protein phosphatase
MRIAVISDIHANLEALQSALAIITERHADEVICLGDTLGYGASPNECLAMVRSTCKHVLLGNHDEAAIDLSKSEYFNRYARAAAEWTYKHLSPENAEYIKHLPSALEYAGIEFAHSSPFEPEAWHYVVSEDDARMNFPFFSTPICFIGHSHTPGVYCEDHTVEEVIPGKRFIINVGSIGQPRDNDPRLSFGIIDTEPLHYENIRAEYDIDAAAEKIIKAGLPRALAVRLYDGR